MAEQTFLFGTTLDQPAPEVLGVGDFFNDDALGTDITPVGWPENAEAIAVEVQLTADAEQTEDGQVYVAVSATDELVPVPEGSTAASGVWSGADGYLEEIGSGGVEAFFFNKFGGWRTEYLTNTTSANGRTTISASASHDGASIDVRARIRRADWDSIWDPGRNRVIAARGGVWGLQWLKASEFATPYIEFLYIRSDLNAYIERFDIDDLGITDGAWCDIQVLADATGIRMFGPAGEAAPSATLGSPSTIRTLASATTTVIGGTGTGSGFDGDMSLFELRTGSGLVANWNLQGMDSSDDTSWPNSTGQTVTRNTDAAGGADATGAVAASTVTARIDLDDLFAMETWRLILNADVDTTLDSVYLEYNSVCCGKIYVGPITVCAC